MKRWLEESTHSLVTWETDTSSQTSASQAGILHGNNSDIPAFRWYDKDQGRLFVSNNFADAYELNQRYAKGQGLLRGGTSINNLMAGENARGSYFKSADYRARLESAASA